MILIKFYYWVKFLIPRRVRIGIRRLQIRIVKRKSKDIWPINHNAGNKPPYFAKWPLENKFAVLLRHDVDTNAGYVKSEELLKIDMNYGFLSSFNFVPEDYHIKTIKLNNIKKNGYEIGVHGLKHDGKLYSSDRHFNYCAERINMYLKSWNSVGFYSPSMHHDLNKLLQLDILYDSSTFDTDPFEPQPDGVNTIFPYVFENSAKTKRYIEIPYTLPQDYTLFILMKENTIDIWKKKIDWIASKNGMVFLNTHPDYMYFGGHKKGIHEYPVDLYVQVLEYIKNKYKGQYWNILPKTMAAYWLKLCGGETSDAGGEGRGA